jgi:hypothetical protein
MKRKPKLRLELRRCTLCRAKYLPRRRPDTLCWRCHNWHKGGGQDRWAKRHPGQVVPRAPPRRKRPVPGIRVVPKTRVSFGLPPDLLALLREAVPEGARSDFIRRCVVVELERMQNERLMALKGST